MPISSPAAPGLTGGAQGRRRARMDSGEPSTAGDACGRQRAPHGQPRAPGQRRAPAGVGELRTWGQLQAAAGWGACNGGLGRHSPAPPPPWSLSRARGKPRWPPKELRVAAMVGSSWRLKMSEGCGEHMGWSCGNSYLMILR